MTIVATEEDIRICSECGELKPLTSFRRRYRDQRHRMGVCNFCHAARERLRRHRKRQQDQLGIQKFATAYCSTRDHGRRRLIAELGIKAAGGFECFLKNWLAAIQDLTARRQSSPLLLRLFELLWELEQDSRRRAAMKNASDLDLTALIDGRMADWIERDPEIVLAAARRLGWTFIPPRDPAAPAESTMAG
jgi:hypothetical protein